MDKRNRGNLFVDRVLWVRGHKLSPDLGALQIKIKNAISIPSNNAFKPRLQSRRLVAIPALPYVLNTATNFAYRLHRNINLRTIDRVPEGQYASVGALSFSELANNMGINEKHA